MAGILKRLTKDSAAADELAEAINAFLRQDWDPELEGDTIPRYVIALACKITDRKKLKLQLEPILQEYAEDFLEW